MDELISIIIPVYNVEKYIDKCIESIVGQSYDNLEIILIDDGSTDNSAGKCDEWKKKDDRIKVIHKKNGGLSDARNSGIQVANGKYFMLVDSDDYVHKNIVEFLYKNIIEYDADISFCDFRKYRENENIKLDSEHIAKRVFNSEEYFRNFYGSISTQSTVAWAKLYKAELFDEVCYPVGKLREDEFTTYKLVHKANRIVYVDEKLYYYLIRENSIMLKTDIKKFVDYIQALYERNQFISENYSELKEIDGEYCIQEMYSAYVESLILNKACRMEVENYYNEIYDRYGKNQGIWFKALRYFPECTALLYRIKRCICRNIRLCNLGEGK